MSCAADGASGCGKTNSARPRPMRPGPMFCSSPTTPPRNWAAIALSAGPRLPASSTSSLNSASAPTVSDPRRGHPSGRVGLFRSRRRRGDRKGRDAKGDRRRHVAGPLHANRDPRLLRERCRRPGAATARDSAADRPAAGAAAGPLHGRRRRHGILRRANRRGDAGAIPGALDGHPGQPDRRDRRGLWGV
jgi:hypothetical protein